MSEPAATAAEAPDVARQGDPERSNAYNIFMLVLTVMSLAIMVLLMLPLAPAELELLSAYDNMICVVFLIDFAINLATSKPRSDYFVRRRGWLDLLGSIPSFGFFRATGLLRLFRLSRLARIMRLLRGNAKKALVKDVLENRGQYAAFITLLAGFFVLVTSSLLIVQFESQAANANITTGGDGLWWALVTITTVGYGDKFPVTPMGRVTATGVMLAGVGIIGALASILASILVPQPKEPEEGAGTAVTRSVEEELAAIRAELAALRAGTTGEASEPTR